MSELFDFYLRKGEQLEKRFRRSLEAEGRGDVLRFIGRGEIAHDYARKKVAEANARTKKAEEHKLSFDMFDNETH